MREKIKDYLRGLSKRKNKSLSVCLLGLGSTNLAVLEAIRNLDAVCDITVRQQSKLSDTPPRDIRIICGKHATDDISEDVIFASPSCRRERLSLPCESVITSDTELFLEEEKNNLFLVSGSDGKSTVTTIASFLLSPTFPELFTGGNLGTPIASASLNADAVLLEMSSFSLRYCTPKCTRSVLTNVTPNHLDWHQDLDEYCECKMKLAKHAKEPVISLSSALLEEGAKEVHSFALVSDLHTSKELRRRYRTEHTVTREGGAIAVDGESILIAESILRKERHAVLNLMNAIALTLGYADKEQIAEVAATFKGLKHRCEIFPVAGKDYVDSSIDTTPARTATTLEGLARPVSIILGGRGKGLSPEPMKSALLKYAKRIALYGEAAQGLYAWLDSDSELRAIPKASFQAFNDAVDYIDAYDYTVLLSPAATSYGEFSSYAERGEHFKEYVLKKHRII